MNTDETMIYVMKVPENLESLDFLLERLPECKKEKVKTIRDGKTRALGSCAWALLSYALKQEWNLNEWPQIQVGPHGKPEFLGKEGLPWFNVSHTDGWVLCVIDDQPVGGDIQKIPVYREKTVKRYTSQEEWHLLNQQSMKERENSAALLWSMKEAYVKYLGTGLTKEISTIDFSKALCQKSRISWNGLFFQRGQVENCFYAVCLEKEGLPVKNIRIEEIMQK